MTSLRHWLRSRGLRSLALPLALLLASACSSLPLSQAQAPSLGPVIERAHTDGAFSAVAWSAGCQNSPKRIGAAIDQYNLDQQTRRGLTRLLWLDQPSAPSECRILGMVAKPNLLTTAFKNMLRDCLNANAGTACTTVALYKYHGLGTSSTAATAADTGCTTELTTEYNPNSTRATGSQTTNGNGVYRTIGTNTVDASAAVVEWCLNSAATSTGNLASHVIFSVINLGNGDSLQTTWDLTLS